MRGSDEKKGGEHFTPHPLPQHTHVFDMEIGLTFAREERPAVRERMAG